MKLSKKIFFLLVLFVASIFGATGQAVMTGVEFSPIAEPGERLRVAYTFNNIAGADFVEPTIQNAKVIARLVKSKDVNGNNIYTYTLGAPQQGTIKLTGAAIVVKGVRHAFQTILIEVMAGNNALSGGSTSGKAKPVSASNEVIYKVDVDKRTVYVGEALCATLNLLMGPKVTQVLPGSGMKYASMGGFWSQDLPQSNAQATRTPYNGRTYTKQVVRQWLLYPQRVGNITIESNTLPIQASLMTGERNRYGEYVSATVEMNLASAPVGVNVLALPKPAPVGYDGAVGQFTMETTVGASTLSANSAGTIVIKLSGNGNFPLIKAPTLKFPVEFEVFETKTKDEINNTTTGTIGTRTWEIPFIARAEGDYTIPALEFSYFDPKTRSYKTLSTGDFKFKITRDTGTGNTATGFVSGVTKEDLRMLGQDIRFIKLTPPNQDFSGVPLVRTVWFYLILLLELAGAVAVLIAMRKYIKLKSDVVRTKSKSANKVAIKRLRKARGYMDADQKDRFFEEMLRALWGYMGDKLAIEVADLTKERIRAELYDRGVESDQAELFLELIAQCEMAQYAPATAVQMRQEYEQALEVIGSMEIK